MHTKPQVLNCMSSSKRVFKAQVLKILKMFQGHFLNRFQRSHQKFLKGSSVLRARSSKFLKGSRKSSKRKMHKRSRSSDLRFSTDPQNVLKFLKRSSKPSKSSEVHKRYSSRHQSPQEVINVVKILWSSKVPQMFIKWSSKSPQNFLKTVLKWSRNLKSRKVLQRASGPQVFKKSSKGPQSPQVKKIHKRYPRSSKVIQLILKMASRFSKGYKSPRSPHRSTKRIQGDFKVQKFKRPQRVQVKQNPQKVKKMHKRYPRSSDLRFSTDQKFSKGVLKFLKRSSKPSKSSEVQKVFQSTSKSPRSYQRPQNPVVVKGSSNAH